MSVVAGGLIPIGELITRLNRGVGLLTVPEIAAVLACSERTIYRMVADGTLTPVGRRGHRLRFSVADVLRFLRVDPMTLLEATVDPVTPAARGAPPDVRGAAPGLGAAPSGSTSEPRKPTTEEPLHAERLSG